MWELKHEIQASLAYYSNGIPARNQIQLFIYLLYSILFD